MVPIILDKTLSLLLALVLILLVSFVCLRRIAVYAAGQDMTVPSGYLLDASYWEPRQARCYVVRLTADGCPYCRADQGQFATLAAAGRAVGCDVIAIGPQLGDVALAPDRGLVQLQYVNFRLGKALVPFRVPQTLLLDERGRLTWNHQGELRAQSVEAATGYLAGMK